MAELITTHIGVTYPWQLDAMGHLNVQHYVGMFDESTWNLFFELGMTPQYFEDERRAMGAVQQNITYRYEMGAGELVEIKSGVLEVEARKIRILHQMSRRSDGVVTAFCEILGVHFDRDRRKACPFPDFIVGRAGDLCIADPRS